MPGRSAQEVSDILAAGMSPRMSRIDQYQRYIDGTIYDGRPSFFDDSEAPLAERAPCVVYPCARNAVDSYSTMCLGEGRFPAITSLTSEDDASFDPRFGLNQTDSTVVDAGIGKISEQTRLPTCSQQLLETALSSGTAVALVCVRKGRLKVVQLDPKVCTPTFDEEDPTCVTSVEVSYRYESNDWDPQEKKYCRHVWQYRRVIDGSYDTVYVPVEILSANDFPKPSTEKTKYKHGFGFCPIVWYKFLAPIAASGDIDGKPIHWGLMSLIDAVNLALSQRHRAAIYCGDPQICEIGVDDEDVRVPMGRSSGVGPPTSDPSGWQMSLSSPKRAGRMSKRKKGAGTVWRYASPDARVEVLTLAGDSLKALSDDAADNIVKLREALGHVYIDPKDLAGSGDISGKTLAFVFASQIAKCNRIREDFGKCCLLPILNMLFRVVLRLDSGLYLAGADKMRKILARFSQNVGSDVVWFDPSLKLNWGDYFELSDIDEATRVQTSINALTAPTPIITRKTAIAHVKTVFGISNVDQYDDALQDEADARAATAAAIATPLQDDEAAKPTPAAKLKPARSRPAKASASPSP